MKTTAEQDETLDDICYRVLGHTDCLEQVIELNSQLLDCPIVPQGSIVELPDDINKQPVQPQTITLWS
ncbi:MAG: tail protein X [Gammaproteobacteria bacterium]|nr:tail protein X [Gammaproteobacteria bacterium]